MKIFIAGCARSGTTLTISLMRCFDDIHVYARETLPRSFETRNYSEQHCVLKRRYDAYKTLFTLPVDIKLLYCVRHPYDCLTSSLKKTAHKRCFHVTLDRWLAEYNGIQALQHMQPYRRLYFLRYEDLVLRPNDIQKSIARHFGLKISYLFTNNPWKPRIFQDSIEKWHVHQEYWNYFESFPRRFMLQVNKFCWEFGYQIPTRRKPIVELGSFKSSRR